MSAGKGGDRLKVGVMGVGSLGFHHARILRELPGAELVGIHDTNAARLAEVGAQLGVPTFPALEELADRVEAAVVAVPTTCHESVARAVLRHGIHVLVEKPIAPTLPEADRILADAAAVGDSAGVRNAFGFRARYRFQQHQAFLRLIGVHNV